MSESNRYNGSLMKIDPGTGQVIAAYEANVGPDGRVIETPLIYASRPELIERALIESGFGWRALADGGEAYRAFHNQTKESAT
jgi:hypothetical protein